LFRPADKPVFPWPADGHQGGLVGVVRSTTEQGRTGLRRFIF